ncbi:MAG: c-type cytochrome [Labilithrix sp.]|nr:c-type cytochrome [Labilithrix sp.]
MIRAEAHRRGLSLVALLVSTTSAGALGACTSEAIVAEPEKGASPPPPTAASPRPPAPAAPEPPSHFPPLPLVPDNPTTGAGFALGRRLFYDARLSRTGTVACATCHEQAHAFTIPEALPARGVTRKPLERHAPSLVNLAWADTGLFWDGGSKNLESLALAPITHVDEMGREGDLDAMMRTIAADEAYPAMFEAAFGAESVTIGNVMRGLAQFQRALFSAGSRWDAWKLGQSAPWSAEEELGREVFTRDCARCHTPGLFTDAGFHNNGLDAAFGDDPEAPRRGRGRVTFSADDVGKYRTPTLRNVAVTGPYMHDGRFATLEEVVAHYRTGMLESPSLDPGFRREDAPPGVAMSDAEARALLSFFELLTDPALGLDSRYANPFTTSP